MFSSLKRRFSFALVALILISASTTACGKKGGGGGNPIGPTPVTSGQVKFSYVPPEPCKAPAGDIRCNRTLAPPTIGSPNIPEPYVLKGVKLSLEEDGVTLSVIVTVPSSELVGGRLRIAVSDPALCPPAQQFCTTEAVTGKGISANGVRLTDGEKETSFGFNPPEIIR